MGIVSRLFEKRNTTTLAAPDSWLVDALGGRRTAAGVRVNEQTALTSSAVFNAIRIYAETIGSLPLLLYRRHDPRGKERARDHYLFELLRTAPNPEMTAMQFRETLQGHAVSWGNAYAYKVHNNAGRVKELWPMRPDRTVPMRLTESVMTELGRRDPGDLVYLYTLPSGEQRVLARESVWHIPGLGFDGVVGYSVIAMARQAIGLSLATEEFGARWFGDGARPSGVLVHPNALSEGARSRMRQDWANLHSGLQQSHRVAILEEGVEWKQIGIPPEDSQFLETRKFQVTEVARWFNLPTHMLKDLERATHSNIEQQSIELVVYSFRPWFVRWEQSIQVHLLPRSEWDRYYAEFLVEGLLRGDTISRYQAYALARQWGWMSANDVLERENENPLPGKAGDIYMVPLNMMPADVVASESFWDGEEDRAAPGPPEKRDSGMRQKLRLARRKLRLQNSFRPVFKDAGARLVRRERADIMREAEKVLGERSLVQHFLSWLDEFYRGHEDFIRRVMRAPVRGLGEAVFELTQDELDSDVASDELDEFLAAYVDSYAERHAKSSHGQLRRVVLDAEADGDDIVEALATRIGEWEERRPDKIAMRETLRLGNAVAYMTYQSSGVRRLRWMTTSGDSCPYCQELHGLVVGIEEPFVRPGDELDPDGSDGPMRVYQKMNHPPLHDGCTCQIVPD